ncbi:MAG: hypothetical protein AAF357_03365 [Verrucomicrobiota bacterium]
MKRRDTLFDAGLKNGIRFRIDGHPDVGDTEITLRLSNIPASEALRYACSLVQRSYSVDGQTIVIAAD